MKAGDCEVECHWILYNEAIDVKVNLEGWWHPRRYIRNAEGEEK